MKIPLRKFIVVLIDLTKNQIDKHWILNNELVFRLENFNNLIVVESVQLSMDHNVNKSDP